MIFISYSWADSIFVRSMASLLIEQGYQVWIDYKDLDLDKPLAPQIISAIQESDLFVLISSPHAYLSRWVQLELLLAQKWCKSIKIIHAPTKVD